MKLQNVFYILFVLLLTACGASTDEPITPTNHLITDVSGNKIGLNGIYQTAGSCHHANAGGTQSTRETLTITGNIWTYNDRRFNNGTCSGSPTTDTTVLATLTVLATDLAISGWLDGSSNSTPAPLAADSSGQLSDTEPYTPLRLTVSASSDPSIQVGNIIALYYIADNTGSALKLWRNKNATHVNAFDAWIRQ